MPSFIPRAIPASTSRKGLMLAESRRAHLVELYKTGRWKRYFTEQEFLARMREAVREVTLWSEAAALWDEPGAGSPAVDREATAREIRVEPIRIEPVRDNAVGDLLTAQIDAAGDVVAGAVMTGLPEPLAVLGSQSVDAAESLS